MQTKWIDSVTYAPEWLEVDSINGVQMTLRVSAITMFAPIPVGTTQEPRTRVRLRCGTSMDVLHTYQQIKDALRGTDTTDRVVRVQPVTNAVENRHGDASMNRNADQLNAKAVLTYFKPDTGKYYASGECLISASAYLVDVWDQVRQWNTYGGLPGLDESSTGWIVHVECPGHPNDHPKLILP